MTEHNKPHALALAKSEQDFLEWWWRRTPFERLRLAQTAPQVLDAVKFSDGTCNLVQHRNRGTVARILTISDMRDNEPNDFTAEKPFLAVFTAAGVMTYCATAEEALGWLRVAAHARNMVLDDEDSEELQ